MIFATNVKEQKQLAPYVMKVITKKAPHAKNAPTIASIVNQKQSVSNVLTVFMNQAVNVKSVTKVVQHVLMEQMHVQNAPLDTMRTTYYDVLNAHKTVMSVPQKITAQTLRQSSF